MVAMNRAKRVIKGISVPHNIVSEAHKQMAKRHLRSFSNYVEILIAEDVGLKKREEVPA